MSRFYKAITKELFLEKVKALSKYDEDGDEGEDYPYDFPAQIEKDLSKIEFDRENFTRFDDTDEDSFGCYPVGYKYLENDLHVFFVNSGGDWEYPICFIFYWDGKQIRAYIPKNGNVYNHAEKCAYGSDSDPYHDHEELDKNFNFNNLIEDIISRIKLKV